jgi:hypothetical protein
MAMILADPLSGAASDASELVAVSGPAFALLSKSDFTLVVLEASHGTSNRAGTESNTCSFSKGMIHDSAETD